MNCIANDLPPEIALREYALNLENQYGWWMKFMIVDMAILHIQQQIIEEFIKKL